MLKTAAVEAEPVTNASTDLDAASISAEQSQPSLTDATPSTSDRAHAESYLEQLRERNEQIENSQIFGADLLLNSARVSHAADRSAEQRLQAELANQEGNSLSTSTSKKKKGASGQASIDVVIQQLETVVPQEQIEALARALKEAQEQQGVNQQVSSSQLLNMVQEIARALKGNDTLLTLQNSGMTTHEAVTALLAAHIDDQQLVEEGARRILQAIEAPPLSLGLSNDSLNEAIKSALEQNRAQDIRGLILSAGISAEEFIARETRRGNFETLRGLMDAGVFSTQETVTIMYAEAQSLYAERGALLGDRHARELEYERQLRLEELNRQITSLEQNFSELLQHTALGQEVQAGLQRAENAARAEVVIERAGVLARDAGLHAELRSARGTENRLNQFLQEEHAAFLEANPAVADLVRAQIETGRDQGQQDYRRVQQAHADFQEALREDYPENRVHAILGRLDYEQMRIFLRIHDQATGRHLVDTIRREFGEDSAVHDAYNATYQRRHHPAGLSSEVIDAAMGAAPIAVGTVAQQSAQLELTARPVDHAAQAAAIQQTVSTFRTDTVATVDNLLTRARERQDYLSLARMRAEMNPEQWQSLGHAYQAERGVSLDAEIAALPQSATAELVLRDAQAIVLANALDRELKVEGVAPDQAFTTFSRLRTAEQVHRAVEAYRTIHGVSVLGEVQRRNELTNSGDAAARVNTELQAVRADATVNTLTVEEELQVLSRLELGVVDPRELQAIEQGDQLSAAVFAVDRALRSQDPISNTYGLTGGYDPAAHPEFIARYEALIGRPYQSPEQVVLERAQNQFNELAMKQSRLAQGTVSNAMRLEEQHEAMTGIGLVNFWSMVSGTRAEISEAADAHWRESDRQFDRAREIQGQLRQSRELSQQALLLLEQARQQSSAGNTAEAQELRFQANGLMRDSLGALGSRHLMVVSDEMRRDLQRFSSGLDSSIGALNDYERYLRTARTVVIAGGAIIATGGLASGAIAPGALSGVFTALGGTTVMTATGTTVVVGGKTAAVVLGTLGVTAAGSVGNITEQTLNVGYGNATVGEAFSNLGDQTYHDFKTAGIASTSVVVGLGTSHRIGTLLRGSPLKDTQVATLLTAGSAGASGSMFSTAADMSVTNIVEGGREVMNENGEIVRERFTLGEITSSTLHSGAVGFLSGGIGGKAELMRNSATTSFGRVMVTSGEAALTTGVGLGSAAVQGNLSVDNLISEVGFAGIGAVQGHMAVRQHLAQTGRTPSNSSVGGELRAQVTERIDQTIHDAAENRRIADGLYLDAGHDPTFHDRVEARVASNRGAADVRVTADTIRSVERAVEGVQNIDPSLRETALNASTAEAEYRMAQQERLLRIRETIRQSLRLPFGDFANRAQEVGNQFRAFVESNARLREVAARTQEARQRLVVEGNVARNTQARTLSPEMRAVAEQKTRIEETRAQARRTVIQELTAPIADGRLPNLSTIRRAVTDSFSGTRFSEVGAQVQRAFREVRAQARDQIAVRRDAQRLGSGVSEDQATPASRALDQAAVRYAEARRGFREGVGALFRELTAPIDMHAPRGERLSAAWQKLQEGLPFSPQRRAAGQEYQQARANFNLEQRIQRRTEALGPREGHAVSPETAAALRESAERLARIEASRSSHIAFWRPRPQIEVVLGEGASRASYTDLLTARRDYRDHRAAYNDQRIENRVTERLSPRHESQHAAEVREAARARAQDVVARRQGYRAVVNEILAPIRDLRAPQIGRAVEGVGTVLSHTRLAQGAREHALHYFDVRGEHRADLSRANAEARRHQEPTGGRETLAVERANHFAGVLADHARSIRQDIHRVAQELRNALYLRAPSLSRIIRAEADIPAHTRVNSDVRQALRGYHESRVTIEADRARTRSLQDQRIDASPEETQQLSRRAQRAMASAQELASRVAEHAAERRRGFMQMRQELLSFLELRAPNFSRMLDGFDAVATNSSIDRSVSETLRAANRDRAIVTGELSSLRRRVELGWKPVEGADDSALARRQRNLNVEALRVSTTEGSFRSHADALVGQLRDPLSLFTRDGLGDLGHHLSGLYNTSSLSRSVRMERGRLYYAQALRQSEAHYQDNRQDLVRDATVSNRQVAADVRAQNMRLGEEGRAETVRALRGIFIEQRPGALRELVSGIADRFAASPLSSTGLRARHAYGFVQLERGLVEFARSQGIQVRTPDSGAEAPQVRVTGQEEERDQSDNQPIESISVEVVDASPRRTPLLQSAPDGSAAAGGPTAPLDPRVAAVEERLRTAEAQLAHERGLLSTVDADGNIDLGQGVKAPRSAIEEGIRQREGEIESLRRDRDRAETFARQDRIMQERPASRGQQPVVEQTPQEQLASLNGRIEGLRRIAAEQQRYIDTGSLPEVELSPGRRMTPEELAAWHDETRQELVDLVRQREILEARIEIPRENPLQPNDPAWRAYQEARAAEVRAEAQRSEARMREIAQQALRGPLPEGPEMAPRSTLPETDAAVVQRRAEFATQLAELRATAREYEVWLQAQHDAAAARNQDTTVFSDEMQLLAQRRRAFDEVAAAGRTAHDIARFDELAEKIRQHGLMLQNNREVLESGFLIQDGPIEAPVEQPRAIANEDSAEGWRDSYGDDDGADFDDFSTGWSPDSDRPGGGPFGGGSGRGTATLDAPVRSRPAAAPAQVAAQTGPILRLSPEGSPSREGFGRLETQNRAAEPLPNAIEERAADPLQLLMEEPRIVVAEPEALARPQPAPLIEQVETMRPVAVLDRNPELDRLFDQMRAYQLQQLLTPVEIEAPSRSIEIDGRPYVLSPETDDVDVITQRVNEVEQLVHAEQQAAVRIRPTTHTDPREDTALRDELEPRYRPETDPDRPMARPPTRTFEEEPARQHRRDGDLASSAAEEEKKKRIEDEYNKKQFDITKADYERNKGGSFSAGLKKRIKNPVVIGEERKDDFLGNDMNDPSRYRDEWIDT